MAITVKLFDAAGASLPEGLAVELVRGAEVVAEARIDNQGTVTFDTDATAPLAVRIKASDEVLACASPSKPPNIGGAMTTGEGKVGASDATSDATPQLVFNGIRRDGAPARPAVDPATLVAGLTAPPADGVEGQLARASGPPQHYGLAAGRSAKNWAHTGWAVVFAKGAPQSLRDALAPLLQQRLKLLTDAGHAELYKELEYQPGDDARAFLGKLGADLTIVNPGKVPYYLMLVGGPESIPFQVQYDLAFGYAVGRLAFDTEADYAAYASSVVEQENTAATTRDVIVFGTRHAADAATRLSDTKLVTPLDVGIPGDAVLGNPPAKEVGNFNAKSLRGSEATRQALLDALAGGDVRPSLLFAACHGLECDPDDDQQKATQGALLCGDWKGIGEILPAALLTADAVKDATVKGLVAFVFACHGAGTTAKDDINGDPANGKALAPTDFVTALPKRLLAHPKGSALAFIGHVNSATGFSIETPAAGGAHVEVYWSAAVGILMGEPVGHAVRPFAERVGALSSVLVSALAPGSSADAMKTASAWMERNDARNQIVLGDPAVRLRV
jgi:hypothetical protein